MKKILVVEDERSTSEILEQRLANSGYEVSVAYDGKDGWDKAISEKPDLILLDIGIPVIDGISLCRLIKKEKKLSNIPVLMLTARKTVGDWEDGFDAGADLYINKPYDWNELVEKISHFIGKQEASYI